MQDLFKQFLVWKLFDKVLAPFEQSYVELAAFLSLCILATAALAVRRHRQAWRFVVQLVSLIVFFLIVSSCLGVFGLIRNAFLGLNLLSQQDDLGAFYWLGMTVVALGAAFVGGAVFCGWICPTGTLQEWAGWVARKAGWLWIRQGRGQESGSCGQHGQDGQNGQHGRRGQREFLRRQPGAALLWGIVVAAYLIVAYRVFSNRRPILEDSATLWAGSLCVLAAIVLIAPRHSNALKRFRLVSLLLILGFTAAGISVFSPVHFIFMNVGDWASLLSALVIIGAAVFVLRAWCRYLCPFGLLCGWAAKHAAFQIERKANCTDCGVCARACEVEAIDNGHIALSSCIACMKCVDHCPEGALALVARPFGERKTVSLLANRRRPSSIVSSKTALLLAVVVGSATHVSSLTSIEPLWDGFRGDPRSGGWRYLENSPTSEPLSVWTFRGSTSGNSTVPVIGSASFSF